MVATPPEQIRAEVHVAYEGHPIPAVLSPSWPSRAGGPGSRGADAPLLGAAIADDWQRIRSLLEHDILYRARQIADGGTRALFADLDETVSWDDGVLRIDKDCGGHEVLGRAAGPRRARAAADPERVRVAEGDSW